MDNLLFKSGNNGQVNVDQAQGIVECFVAGIGNKDSVGDIVISGAFAKSLTHRKPRVVWGHSWNDPIGKVLEMYEVPIGDSRLPAKMRNAGIGGLYAKVQFNLQSEKGKEAFATVAFFGEDQEWSIGYKTIDSIFDQGLQANILKEVELYEVSPVLHGANQLTGTISIKTDEKAHMPIIPLQGEGIQMMPMMNQAPRIVVVATPNNQQNESTTDNPFAEGMSRELSQPDKMALQAELIERTGSKIEVMNATENIVVFRRTTSDGKASMYRLPYHKEGNQFMFGKPEPYEVEALTPQPMQNIEQKPGAPVVVPNGGIAYRNDDQQEMLTMFGGSVESPFGKSEISHLIELPESYMASARDFVNPVLRHHKLVGRPSAKGIIIDGVLTASALDALQNAVKALGSTIGQVGGNIGQAIGKIRDLAQTFNPYALDGDGDGFVQDGSAFQRPYIPIKKPGFDLPDVRGRKRSGDKLLDKPRPTSNLPKDRKKWTPAQRQEALVGGLIEPETREDVAFLANKRPENEGIAKYWDMSEADLTKEGNKLINARKQSAGTEKEKIDEELLKVSHEFQRRASYAETFGQDFVPPAKREVPAQMIPEADKPEIREPRPKPSLTDEGLASRGDDYKEMFDSLIENSEGQIDPFGKWDKLGEDEKNEFRHEVDYDYMFAVHGNLGDDGIVEAMESGQYDDEIEEHAEKVWNKLAQDAKDADDVSRQENAREDAEDPRRIAEEAEAARIEAAELEEERTERFRPTMAELAMEAEAEDEIDGALERYVGELPFGDEDDEDGFASNSSVDEITTSVPPEKIAIKFEHRDLDESDMDDDMLNALNEHFSDLEKYELVYGEVTDEDWARVREDFGGEQGRDGGESYYLSDDDFLDEIVGDRDYSDSDYAGMFNQLKDKYRGGFYERHGITPRLNPNYKPDGFASRGEPFGFASRDDDGEVKQSKLDEMVEDVKTKLIAELETANPSTWKPSWRNDSLPINPTTGKPYRGFNAFWLMMRTRGENYSTGRFAGFNQLKARGAQVRKGEKGVPILRPQLVKKEDKDGNVKEFVVFRGSTVFNIDQTDGGDEALRSIPADLPEEQRIKILEATIAELGVSVKTDNMSGPHYSPTGDYVSMPDFSKGTSALEWNSSLAHETIHWTGGASRLNRPSVANYSDSKQIRAYEELVAEIGSAMFLAAHGIDAPFREDHAPYIKGWISLLKDDPDALSRAFKDATAAINHILEKSPNLRKLFGGTDSGKKAPEVDAPNLVGAAVNSSEGFASLHRVRTPRSKALGGILYDDSSRELMVGFLKGKPWDDASPRDRDIFIDRAEAILTDGNRSPSASQINDYAEELYDDARDIGWYVYSDVDMTEVEELAIARSKGKNINALKKLKKARKATDEDQFNFFGRDEKMQDVVSSKMNDGFASRGPKEPQEGLRRHKLMTAEIRGKMPQLDTTEDVPTDEKILAVKFFSPYSDWTWYGVEFDGEDMFFGYVEGFEKEWGYFSLDELAKTQLGGMVPAVERDTSFRPTKFGDLNKADGFASTGSKRLGVEPNYADPTWVDKTQRRILRQNTDWGSLSHDDQIDWANSFLQEFIEENEMGHDLTDLMNGRRLNSRPDIGLINYAESAYARMSDSHARRRAQFGERPDGESDGFASVGRRTRRLGMQPSEAVDFVAYDPESESLFVAYKREDGRGDMYVYEGVSMDDAVALESAPSAGRAINDIKRRKDVRKATAEEVVGLSESETAEGNALKKAKTFKLIDDIYSNPEHRANRDIQLEINADRISVEDDGTVTWESNDNTRRYTISPTDDGRYLVTSEKLSRGGREEPDTFDTVSYTVEDSRENAIASLIETAKSKIADDDEEAKLDRELADVTRELDMAGDVPGVESIDVTYSTALDAVDYNPATKEMRITYKDGGTYIYEGVDADEVDAFKSAPSKGRATNDIKRAHSFRKDSEWSGGGDDDFDIEEFDVSGSEAVEQVSYDPEKEDLMVVYAGGKGYVYSGVTREEADAFRSAPSKGRAINDVKRTHEVRKLTGEDVRFFGSEKMGKLTPSEIQDDEEVTDAEMPEDVSKGKSFDERLELLEKLTQEEDDLADRLSGEFEGANPKGDYLTRSDAQSSATVASRKKYGTDSSKLNNDLVSSATPAEREKIKSWLDGRVERMSAGRTTTIDPAPVAAPKMPTSKPPRGGKRVRNRSVAIEMEQGTLDEIIDAEKQGITVDELRAAAGGKGGKYTKGPRKGKYRGPDTITVRDSETGELLHSNEILLTSSASPGSPSSANRKRGYIRARSYVGRQGHTTTKDEGPSLRGDGKGMTDYDKRVYGLGSDEKNRDAGLASRGPTQLRFMELNQTEDWSDLSEADQQEWIAELELDGAFESGATAKETRDIAQDAWAQRAKDKKEFVTKEIMKTLAAFREGVRGGSEKELGKYLLDEIAFLSIEEMIDNPLEADSTDYREALRLVEDMRNRVNAYLDSRTQRNDDGGFASRMAKPKYETGKRSLYGNVEGLPEVRNQPKSVNAWELLAPSTGARGSQGNYKQWNVMIVKNPDGKYDIVKEWGRLEDIDASRDSRGMGGTKYGSTQKSYIRRNVTDYKVARSLAREAVAEKLDSGSKYRLTATNDRGDRATRDMGPLGSSPDMVGATRSDGFASMGQELQDLQSKIQRELINPGSRNGKRNKPIDPDVAAYLANPESDAGTLVYPSTNEGDYIRVSYNPEKRTYGVERIETIRGFNRDEPPEEVVVDTADADTSYEAGSLVREFAENAVRNAYEDYLSASADSLENRRLDGFASSGRMAASKEQIDKFRNAIAPLDTQERRARYLRGDYPRSENTQDLDVRYAFDMFWEAVDAGDLDYSDFENLNDAKLRTAMRNVVPKLVRSEDDGFASRANARPADVQVELDKKKRLRELEQFLESTYGEGFIEDGEMDLDELIQKEMDEQGIGKREATKFARELQERYQEWGDLRAEVDNGEDGFASSSYKEDKDYIDLDDDDKKIADAIQEAIDSGEIKDESLWSDWVSNKLSELSLAEQYEAVYGEPATSADIQEYASQSDEFYRGGEGRWDNDIEQGFYDGSLSDVEPKYKLRGLIDGTVPEGSTYGDDAHIAALRQSWSSDGFASRGPRDEEIEKTIEKLQDSFYELEKMLDSRDPDQNRDGLRVATKKQIAAQKSKIKNIERQLSSLRRENSNSEMASSTPDGFASRGRRIVMTNGDPSMNITIDEEDGDAYVDAIGDGYREAGRTSNGKGRYYPESGATYGGSGLGDDQEKEILDTLKDSSDPFVKKLLEDLEFRGRLSDKQWAILKSRAGREKKKTAPKKPSGFVSNVRNGGTIAPGTAPSKFVTPTREQIADIAGLEKIISNTKYVGRALRFNYNGKEREVFPINTYTNPKTGKVNMVGQDAEGIQKTFTLDKMSPSKMALSSNDGFASGGETRKSDIRAISLRPGNLLPNYFPTRGGYENLMKRRERDPNYEMPPVSEVLAVAPMKGNPSKLIVTTKNIETGDTRKFEINKNAKLRDVRIPINRNNNEDGFASMYPKDEVGLEQFINQQELELEDYAIMSKLEPMKYPPSGIESTKKRIATAKRDLARIQKNKPKPVEEEEEFLDSIGSNADGFASRGFDPQYAPEYNEYDDEYESAWENSLMNFIERIIDNEDELLELNESAGNPFTKEELIKLSYDGDAIKILEGLRDEIEKTYRSELRESTEYDIDQARADAYGDAMADGFASRGTPNLNNMGFGPMDDEYWTTSDRGGRKTWEGRDAERETWWTIQQTDQGDYEVSGIFYDEFGDEEVIDFGTEESYDDLEGAKRFVESFETTGDEDDGQPSDSDIFTEQDMMDDFRDSDDGFASRSTGTSSSGPDAPLTVLNEWTKFRDLDKEQQDQIIQDGIRGADQSDPDFNLEAEKEYIIEEWDGAAATARSEAAESLLKEVYDLWDQDADADNPFEKNGNLAFAEELIKNTDYVEDLDLARARNIVDQVRDVWEERNRNSDDGFASRGEPPIDPPDPELSDEFIEDYLTDNLSMGELDFETLEKYNNSDVNPLQRAVILDMYERYTSEDPAVSAEAVDEILSRFYTELVDDNYDSMVDAKNYRPDYDDDGFASRGSGRSEEDKKEIIAVARAMGNRYTRSVLGQYNRTGELSDAQWNALDRMTKRRDKKSGKYIRNTALIERRNRERGITAGEDGFASRGGQQLVLPEKYRDYGFTKDDLLDRLEDDGVDPDEAEQIANLWANSDNVWDKYLGDAISDADGDVSRALPDAAQKAYDDYLSASADRLEDSRLDGFASRGFVDDIDVSGSTAVERVAYDPDKEELLVVYEGGNGYIYSGVTPEEVDGLKYAPSKGRAINEIKRTHDVRKTESVEDGLDFSEREYNFARLNPEEQNTYFQRALANNADSGLSSDAILDEAKKLAMDDRKMAQLERQAVGMGASSEPRKIDVSSSSALNYVAYDEKNRALDVEYRGRNGKGTGTLYRYQGVEPDVVDRIEGSDSRGATVRELRDNYEFTTSRRLPDSAYEGLASRASINESSTGQRIVPSRMHSDDRESLAEVTDPEERKKRIDELIDFYGRRIFAKPSSPRRKRIVQTQDENGFWVNPDGTPADYDEGFASRGSRRSTREMSREFDKIEVLDSTLNQMTPGEAEEYREQLINARNQAALEMVNANGLDPKKIDSMYDVSTDEDDLTLLEKYDIAIDDADERLESLRAVRSMAQAKEQASADAWGESQDLYKKIRNGFTQPRSYFDSDEEFIESLRDDHDSLLRGVQSFVLGDSEGQSSDGLQEYTLEHDTYLSSDNQTLLDGLQKRLDSAKTEDEFDAIRTDMEGIMGDLVESHEQRYRQDEANYDYDVPNVTDDDELKPSRLATFLKEQDAESYFVGFPSRGDGFASRGRGRQGRRGQRMAPVSRYSAEDRQALADGNILRSRKRPGKRRQGPSADEFDGFASRTVDELPDTDVPTSSVPFEGGEHGPGKDISLKKMWENYRKYSQRRGRTPDNDRWQSPDVSIEETAKFFGVDKNVAAKILQARDPRSPELFIDDPYLASEIGDKLGFRKYDRAEDLFGFEPLNYYDDKGNLLSNLVSDQDLEDAVEMERARRAARIAAREGRKVGKSNLIKGGATIKDLEDALKQIDPDIKLTDDDGGPLSPGAMKKAIDALGVEIPWSAETYRKIQREGGALSPNMIQYLVKRDILDPSFAENQDLTIGQALQWPGFARFSAPKIIDALSQTLGLSREEIAKNNRAVEQALSDARANRVRVISQANIRATSLKLTRAKIAKMVESLGLSAEDFEKWASTAKLAK